MQSLARRQVLAGLGLSLVGACATTPGAPTIPAAGPGAPVSATALNANTGTIIRAPVKVSMDRILKTTVGLRPYRRGGFRLNHEVFLGKSVVHNYGHGGDGMTLSWGCSLRAAELARASGEADIGVIGAGVMGLTTAIILRSWGHDVTIYAEDFPPNTTSNKSGAIWLAPGGVSSRIIDTAREGFGRYLDKPGYGVKMVDHFTLSQRIPYAGDPSFMGRYIRRQSRTFVIDPDLYLQSLFEDARKTGVKIVQMRLANGGDIADLPQKSFVNCSGLGARELFGDTKLAPVRGQLTILKPQKDIDYSYIAATDNWSLYMFPRETGIALGGTREMGNSDLTVNEDQVRNHIAAHAALANNMAAMAGV